MSGARNLGGSVPRSAYGADTRAGSYPFPDQSILHREDIPHTAFDVRALLFVGAFVCAISGFLIGSFYVLSWIFGV